MLLLLSCLPHPVSTEARLPPGLPRLVLPEGTQATPVATDGSLPTPGGPRPGEVLALPAELSMGRVQDLLNRQAAAGADQSTLISGVQGAVFNLQVGSTPASPALEIALLPDQVAWHRGAGPWNRLPDLSGGPDLAGLRSALKEDRSNFPDATTVDIFVDPHNSWGRSTPVLGELTGYPRRMIHVVTPPAEAPEGFQNPVDGWAWQLHPYESVDLPSFTAGRPLGGPRLSLRADGKLYLEEEALPDATGATLGPALAGKGEEVLLFVDGDQSSEKLGGLIAALRSVGIRRLGLRAPGVPELALPVGLRVDRSRLPVTVQLGTLGLSVGRGDPAIFLGATSQNLDRLLRVLKAEEPDPSRGLLLELDPRVQVAELVPVLDALTAAGWSYPSLEVKLVPALLQPVHEPGPVYRSPQTVRISPDGTFVLDKVKISLFHVTDFSQRCEQGRCATFATLENKEQWFLGFHPQRPADSTDWIFQRPVGAWTGEMPKTEPQVQGRLRMLIGAPEAAPPGPDGRQMVENGAS
ncbi:MAG TPA: hypothetical protein PLA94_22730, partial [Myxococcota bacterium]|nr:hypothetical protein [Myxococcota bacterium]